MNSTRLREKKGSPDCSIGKTIYALRPRAARRRRNVTPELLSRVLELYEKSGIHVVMDEFDYSERNARRLIARARKELPARG